jgi:hypothetical protein
LGLARSFTLVSELHLGVRSEEIADEIPRVPLIGLGVRTHYFVGASPVILILELLGLGGLECRHGSQVPVLLLYIEPVPHWELEPSSHPGQEP